MPKVSNAIIIIDKKDLNQLVYIADLIGIKGKKNHLESLKVFKIISENLKKQLKIK